MVGKIGQTSNWTSDPDKKCPSGQVETTKWTLDPENYPEVRWSTSDFNIAVSTARDRHRKIGNDYVHRVTKFVRPDPNRVRDYMIERIMEVLEYPAVLTDPEITFALCSKVDVNLSEPDLDALSEIMSRYVQDSKVADRIPYQPCGEVWLVNDTFCVPYYCLWEYSQHYNTFVVKSEKRFGSVLTVETSQSQIEVRRDRHFDGKFYAALNGWGDGDAEASSAESRFDALVALRDVVRHESNRRFITKVIESRDQWVMA